MSTGFLTSAGEVAAARAHDDGAFQAEVAHCDAPTGDLGECAVAAVDRVPNRSPDRGRAVASACAVAALGVASQAPDLLRRGLGRRPRRRRAARAPTAEAPPRQAQVGGPLRPPLLRLAGV